MINASGAVFKLLVSIFLARWLGVFEYGLYSFVYSIVMLIALLMQFGIPQFVLRETARATADSTWERVVEVWRWSNVAVLIMSSLTIVLTAVVGSLLLTDLDVVEAFWVALFLPPLLALLNLTNSKIKGLKRVLLGQVPEVIARPFVFLFVIVAMLLVFSEIEGKATTAFFLHGVSVTIAIILSLAILRVSRPFSTSLKTTATLKMNLDWLRSTMVFALVGGVYFVNAQVDILMLGVLRNNEEVGIYKVTIALSGLISFGMMSVDKIASPKIAALSHSGKGEELQRYARHIAIFSFCFALLPAIVFFTFGELILGFLFGEAFSSGGGVLRILCFGQLVNATLGSVSTLLTMSGYERETLKGVALAAILNVVLNGIMIPVYGMIGAAIASSASLVFWNIYLWFVVRERLGIDSSVFAVLSSYRLFK